MDGTRTDEPTATLLEQARAGDDAAWDTLLRRYLPRLRRWAGGRVPSWARGAADTDDFVQETVANSLRTLKTFEFRHDGALQAYLRQAVLNRVRTQFRRARVRGSAGTPGIQALADVPSQEASPLELAVGAELLERYERALAKLPDEDRELVIARVEMGYSHQELASMFARPTSDAARVAAARAVLRLAREMGRD